MKLADTISLQEWEPREALAFCEFLDGLHDAIWTVHGEQMELHLQGITVREEANDSSRFQD